MAQARILEIKPRAIALLEQKMNPVQWFICQLHELPLRHLMQYVDGKITGPAKFGCKARDRIFFKLCKKSRRCH